MTKNSNLAQSGFTIVELMIAISVLAVVLLITTIGIVRIGESYYKGIVQANTQTAARTILNNVVQNIEYGGIKGTSVSATPQNISGVYGGVVPYSVNVFCMGYHRYSYVMNYRLSSTTAVSNTDPTSKHVLWKDTMPDDSCLALDIGKDTPIGVGTPASTPGSGGSELVGQNMRLTNFAITSVPGSTGNLYKVSVTVMYGADDLIDRSDPGGMPKWKCKSTSGLMGAAFCAKSELSTTVGKRLR